jgi:hypothetical protein
MSDPKFEGEVAGIKYYSHESLGRGEVIMLQSAPAHWGGDEITVEGVQPTPEGEEFLARLADSVRGRK